MPADCDQETHRQIHTDHATAVTIGRILVRCGLTARYEPGERCRAVRRLPRGETAAAAAGRRRAESSTDRPHWWPAATLSYLHLPSCLPSFPVLLLPVPLAHWSARPPPLRRSTPASRGQPTSRAGRSPASRRPSPSPARHSPDNAQFTPQ